VNQQSDGPRIGIFESVLLLLAFDELTVESSLEDWRVEASNVFVDIQWFFSTIFAGIESHDILRIPVARN
jgi:hypothetical protein